MKQYTTPEQTAKLIELGVGFRPALIWKEPFEGRDTIIYDHFSIGELIEMLPVYCWYKYGDKAFRALIQIKFYLARWHIVYRKIEEGHCGHLYDCGSDELIDALYNMIVRLKEKGVI